MAHKISSEKETTPRRYFRIFETWDLLGYIFFFLSSSPFFFSIHDSLTLATSLSTRASRASPSRGSIDSRKINQRSNLETRVPSGAKVKDKGGVFESFQEVNALRCLLINVDSISLPEDLIVQLSLRFPPRNPINSPSPLPLFLAFLLNFVLLFSYSVLRLIVTQCVIRYSLCESNRDEGKENFLSTALRRGV